VPEDPTPSPTTGWKDGSERERLSRRDPVRDPSSPAQRHTAHQQVSYVMSIEEQTSVGYYYYTVYVFLKCDLHPNILKEKNVQIFVLT
jgi:hypothetical protein